LRDDGTWQLDLKTIPFTFPDSPLVVGQHPYRWRVPFDITVVGVSIAVATPPNADLIFDLNRAVAGAPTTWASLYSTQANRPKVTSGNYGGESSAAPDTVDIPEGDFLTFEIDTTLPGTPGSYAVVDLIYYVRG
jgi:hypothetical protein